MTLLPNSTLKWSKKGLGPGALLLKPTLLIKNNLPKKTTAANVH